MRTMFWAAIALAALATSASASAQYDYDSACADSKNNAESAASDLASYARRLQQCAENEDFTDDCYTEFRRVKSAYEEYESSVSSVSSDCN